MEDNYISSLSKKISIFSNNLDTKTILVSLVSIGFLFFVIGATKANIINTSTFVIVIITSICVYLYIKKSYNKKFRYLKLKNKILKRNSILDELCKNKKISKNNRKLCNKYGYARKNFYIISNLLLQQFNINN